MAADGDGLWAWLDERVRRGEGTVMLGLTESGAVGVWLHGDVYHSCIASGDTAREALLAARTAVAASREGKR